MNYIRKTLASWFLTLAIKADPHIIWLFVQKAKELGNE